MGVLFFIEKATPNAFYGPKKGPCQGQKQGFSGIK
jgi:hypothetical protein